MSTSAAPFGLRVAYHPSGVARPSMGSIASAYPTNIFKGSPVRVTAAGTLEVAAAGTTAVGIFLGVEYADSEGIQQNSNRWLASTVATNVRAYYTQDPNIVYEIQADASLALTGMLQQYDWTALAGNTTTGLSSVALGISTAAANAGLRVIGVNPGPDNDWGDAFTIALVQFSEHQSVATIASV